MGFRLAPLTRQHAVLVLRVDRYAQPVGALGAVVSFVVPIGWTAGLLAALWLLVCLVASLAGLVEVVESRSLHPAHLLPAAALGVLSVAAAWLVAFRSGSDFGYSPTIAELTAVHFLHAGVAARDVFARGPRHWDPDHVGAHRVRGRSAHAHPRSPAAYAVGGRRRDPHVPRCRLRRGARISHSFPRYPDDGSRPRRPQRSRLRAGRIRGLDGRVSEPGLILVFDGT